MTERNKSWWTMLCSALIVIAFLAALSGCSTVTTSPEAFELGGKVVEVSTDRFTEYRKVRTVEEMTKQKVIELNIAQAQVEIAQAQSTVVTIDTPEKAAIFGMLEMGKAMSRAVVALAQRDGNPYGLATTPTPKGVIAESLKAAGEFVKDVGNAPAAIVLSTALPMVSLGKAAVSAAGDSVGGDKITTTGDENSITTTRNPVTTTATTTGATSAATANPPAAAEAPVEEVPAVVE